MRSKAIIIGGGLGGLAAGCLLGKAGYQVTVLEKNGQLGGRAGQLKARGFTFDTGPSWYLMPEVFERFFALMGTRVEDHLDLVRLSPSYQVFYQAGAAPVTITGDIAQDAATFARIEPGADIQLYRYLRAATALYHTALDSLLYAPYEHPRDMLRWDIMREARRLKIFKSLHHDVRQYFRDPRLQQIMEYPAVFLGATPYNLPAFYGLLNHALFNQGVFYPRGGIYRLVEALITVGRKYGVTYHPSVAAEQIIVENGMARGVLVDGQLLPADSVISNADIHYTETSLLPAGCQEYSPRYWRQRTLAPSALLMYLGVDRQYPSLQHHTLLFSHNWRQNFRDISRSDHFPPDPSLYVCAPSKTNTTVAPPGQENLFILVPVAAGLRYQPDQLAAYADSILSRMEQQLGLRGLRSHIVYQKLFCVDDFAQQWHSFRGSGLGLAHTLLQTAGFRPHQASRKVRNLYYVGANVHPGIGMPSALISAELVYRQITGL